MVIINFSDFAVSDLPDGLFYVTSEYLSETQVRSNIGGMPTTAGEFTISTLASIPAANVTGATSAVTVTGEIKVTVDEGDPTPTPTIGISAVEFDDLKVGVYVSDAKIVFTVTNGEFGGPFAEDFNVQNLPDGLEMWSWGKDGNTKFNVGIRGTPTTAGENTITSATATIPARNVTGATSAVTVTGEIEVTINKANGAAVSGAPTEASKSANSITITAVTIPSTPAAKA